IRISGLGSIDIVNSVFKGKDLAKVASHTVHFCTIRDGETILDEVLVTVFRSPASFTKEDSVEISCHGSDYIIRNILKLLVKKGARIARPGEFTQRAFLNGQFDLVQAEAVADLIAADSEASHRTALHQLRGGFSKQLASLREELIHFASLIELELDFSEEDVEFAGRDELRELIHKLNGTLVPLIESFDFGNVIKEGVPVAIIGAPNVGKSTLLNALLNEEKAIVTEIAGTTRDVIEDTLVIGGIKFRIIDTAGIRETQDVVEWIGIERSKKAMGQAGIVLLVFDSEENRQKLEILTKELTDQKKFVWVRNKADFGELLTPTLSSEERELEDRGENTCYINEQHPPLAPKERGQGGEVTYFEEFKYLTTKIPNKVLENARSLRQSQTQAEKALWRMLRNRQLSNLKFRRQYPVEEGFVIDFFCPEYRLGIEVDGEVHNDADQQLYDEARTQRLHELYGIQIIRLSNQEVISSPEKVLKTIIQSVEKRKLQLENVRRIGEEAKDGSVLKHLTPTLSS